MSGLMVAYKRTLNTMRPHRCVMRVIIMRVRNKMRVCKIECASAVQTSLYEYAYVCFIRFTCDWQLAEIQSAKLKRN